MTNNKTTLEWLVKNFHPRHEEIFESFRADRGSKLTYAEAEAFRIALFPEALETFARHVWDQACREQREICAQAYIDYNGEEFDYETVSEAIYEALTPEFKLTENEYE